MERKAKKMLVLCSTAILTILFLYSCASIGRPEGGPKDETPPVLVSSSPAINTTNYNKSKITLHFDEFIKLENASEKVVVSPPQLQQPIIKPMGKKITITLQDTLQPNTTYTIDFGDAIVDNNEGNPMGEFTYTFATGDVIDTMAVSGFVLEAENLEPIKNIMVGLQKNLNDTAFTTEPFTRVALTDSKGKFTVHGIAPGEYKVFALGDTDKNYYFSQKSEKIAFLNDIIIPSVDVAVKLDTIWKDSLTVDTIIQHDYSKFLPDDILLRAFTEKHYSQYLIKSERKTENILTLYFAEMADPMPTIKGINFDESNLVADYQLPSDTIINYFVKDSLIFSKDSLLMKIDYLYTDTLDQLVNKTDTLLFFYKHKVAKKEKPDKKGKITETEDADEIEIIHLDVQVKAEASLEVYDYIQFKTSTPIEIFEQSKISLQQKNDSIWEDLPTNENQYRIEPDYEDKKAYNLYYNWKPGNSYQLKVDSAAIKDIYHLTNKEIVKEFTVKKLEEYGSVEFTITGLDEPNAFIELLDSSDKVVRTENVKNNKCGFYYLAPGKYGARMVIDKNQNGRWDTGNYEEKLQPEEVYYYPNQFEFKANWSTTQDWDLKGTKLEEQKPYELKKQKPDEDKKKKEDEAKKGDKRR